MYYDNQREWKRIASQVSTGTAVQSPFTFYNAINNDWSATHNYDYWNIHLPSTDNTVIKTIYDPGISGFVTPKSNSYNNFTTNSDYTTNSSQFNVVGNFAKGWYFYSNTSAGKIFFHALGIRDTEGDDGKLVGVNSRCYYWAAGTDQSNRAACLGFSTSHMSPIGRNIKSSGFIYRPVLE